MEIAANIYSHKQVVLLIEVLVFHAIFWGKIFTPNMCPCKVYANFHVWSSYWIYHWAATWAVKNSIFIIKTTSKTILIKNHIQERRYQNKTLYFGGGLFFSGGLGGTYGRTHGCTDRQGNYFKKQYHARALTFCVKLWT